MIDLGTGRRPSSLEAVSLSLDEMQFLVQLLELDQLPTVLMALGRYDSRDEHEKAMAAARSSLEERGLLRDTNAHQNLEERLRALARPHWVLAARLYVGDTISRLCLAKGEEMHVLVLRGPDSYVVYEVSGEEAVGPAAAALGVIDPLEFAGFSAPTEQLGPIFNTVGDPAATARRLTELGAPADGAEAVAKAMVHCHARIEIVGVVYGDAKREVAPGNIAVFDTHNGRIVITSSIAPDGIKWSSLTSGTPARLRRAMQELIDSLPDRESFPIRPQQA